MNCQEFWDTVPESEELSGDAQLRHLIGCRECEARMEMQRGLLRGLKSLAAESRRQSAPPRVETRLLTAYRGHTGALEPPRRGWLPVLTWAAAAVLAAIGLFLIWGRPPAEPAERTSPRRMELATTRDNNLLTLASYDGEFVALPNASEISPDEEVNLVRLELPRSAVLALGLPVAADRLPDTVEADFVLGADGRPRAVRFVEE